MIIGIAGKAGAGKDTTALLLCELLIPQRVRVYKFADSIKTFCRQVFDWTEDHTDGDLKEKSTEPCGLSPREAVQALGDWGRRVNPDAWVNMLLRKIMRDMYTPTFTSERKGSSSGFGYVMNIVDIAIIADVRYRNEAEAVKTFGGEVLYIEGGGLDGPTGQHSSELSLTSVKPLSFATVDNSRKDMPILKNRLEEILVRLGRGGENPQENAVYKPPVDLL